MKYRIGDRFKYFSIVGEIERENKYNLFEGLCDCGEFFQFPTNKAYDREHKTCSTTQKCLVYKSVNKKALDWPVDMNRRHNSRCVFKVKKEQFKKVKYKSCKTCNRYDLSLFFHIDMQQTCLGCLGSQTPDEFRANKNVREKEKKKDTIKPIEKVIGGAKDKDGYVYIMYSPSMNLYKVGVSINPFIRVISVASHEYKIRDLKLICIGNPLGRSFSCEKYIHNTLRGYKAKYTKPSGGVASELFSCTLTTAANVFLSVCQEAYWLDDITRYLINFDVPKISTNEINEVRGKKKKEQFFINKIAKCIIKERYKNAKSWNLFKWCRYSNMSCYAMGGRDDHRYECYYDKFGKAISLGVYEDYREAKQVHREFSDFVRREKKGKAKRRRNFPIEKLSI